MHPFSRLCTLALVALTAACAAIPAAHIALPEPLAAQPAILVQGLGAARGGEFSIAGERGSFERGATFLGAFGTVGVDRFTVKYATATTRASCRGRQAEATLGIVQAQLRAFDVQCDYEGGFTGRLSLRGGRAAAGAPASRSGLLTTAGLTVDIASVHRLQGSPLPLADPVGYVLSIDGRPVGAVELTDSRRPRAWLPAEPGAQQSALAHAALTLALLWDPSQRAE